MNYNELNFQGLQTERQWEVSEAFPVLMRKVYVWMTLALAITGFTAYGVATSPGILQAIYTNQILFWGLIIAEFALVLGVSAAINHRYADVYPLFRHQWHPSVLYLFGLYGIIRRYGVLHYRRHLWRNGPDRLYHEGRSFVDG